MQQESTTQNSAAGQTAIKPPSTFAQFKTLFKKDIQQEFRTKDMLGSMGIYAVLVLIVFGATLGQVASGTDVLNISSGLLWSLVVFTSLMGLNRSFNNEKQQGCLDGILLAPIDRSVIFLAKAASNFVFLLAVEIIAVPLFWFLFLTSTNMSDASPLVLLVLLVGTIGIAGIGTLLASMTINTKKADVMLTVLFVPVAFPLLYACASASAAVIIGGQGFMDTFTASLALAGAYDVIMLLLSWVLYDFVISA